MVVPGLPAGEGAGRARGAGRGLPRGGVRLARRRLLDVPGDEPRHRGARRARRVDLEPQLRGAAGARGPVAPGLAPDGGGGRAIEGHFVGIREMAAEIRADESDRNHHRQRLRARVGTTSTPTRSSPSSSSSGSSGPGSASSCSTTGPRSRGGSCPATRSWSRAQLRLRLEPGARPVGARGLRLSGDHRAELRRHLPLQLHQDRPAAGRAASRGCRAIARGRGGAGRSARAGGAVARRARLASRSIPRSSTGS